MKRIARSLGAVVLLASAAVPAQEQPLETIPVDPEAAAAPSDSANVPYNWAAARFLRVEYDESSADGLGIEGSYLLLPNIYGVGALFLGEGDASETTQVELGAGFRTALTPAIDANAAFRFVKLETDAADGSQVADDIGYKFDAGVRTLLMERLEGAAGLTFASISGEAGHTFLTGSALYRVLPQMSVGIEALYGNSSYSYGLLGRWAF
jgi:hypothetical protein